MYVDDLQLHGQVGRVVQQSMTQTQYFLNTHLHFDVAYNNEGIDVKGENRVRELDTARVLLRNLLNPVRRVCVPAYSVYGVALIRSLSQRT